LQLQTDGSLLAPDLFTLAAHPTQEAVLRDNAASLASAVQRAGDDAGLRFLAPPTIRVTADASLPVQQVTVSAAFSLADGGDTSAIQLLPRQQGDAPASGAFLIVGGERIVPLAGPGVTMGRRSDLPLVIDHPRVSRVHAQIRLVQGRYVIFDLDSTGGTFVNGQRVMQCPLRPGDIISLAAADGSAGVQIVFGQDIPGPLDDTQEIHLPDE
jgi:hypothetical protein